MLIKSNFMCRLLNNMNPPKFGKNHTCDSKLILNYVRSSGTYLHIKCDRTIPTRNFVFKFRENLK